MSSSRPEWLSELEKQLKENPKFVSYALGTLSPEGKPKTRFVIHRGVTKSGLLLTTTDTRMQKPVHLAHDPTVELAWWIEDPAIQFRITGKAAVISSDPSSSANAIKMFGVENGEEGNDEFWQAQRKKIWGEFSGHLRGSFGRPPPGTPLEQVKEKPDDWIVKLDKESEDEKQKKDIEFAYSHLAILAIQATEAEMLELKPSPNRRAQWKKQQDGLWSKTDVAP